MRAGSGRAKQLPDLPPGWWCEDQDELFALPGDPEHPEEDTRDDADDAGPG